VGEFRDALFGAGDPSRPITQSQGGAIYSRPATQPGLQPGSQPFDLSGSQPYAGPPSRTTVLANAARWIGIASIALMGLATLMVLIGAAGGDTSDPLAGFGILLAFPPLASGPTALIMGIIALIRPQTLQTPDGRRHAILGIATGAVTLLLCCVIGAIAGMAGHVDR
jgi:hypothetical protein